MPEPIRFQAVADQPSLDIDDFTGLADQIGTAIGANGAAVVVGGVHPYQGEDCVVVSIDIRCPLAPTEEPTDA